MIRVYGGKRIEFGREYMIPKPFDPRVLLWETVAVAQAAMDTGVARTPIADMEAYKDRLEARLGRTREMMRFYIHKAQKAPKRIVFPEGQEDKILRAANIIVEEKIATPILIGSRTIISQKISELGLDLEDVEVINPKKSPKLEEYVSGYFELRKRKGITR